VVLLYRVLTWLALALLPFYAAVGLALPRRRSETLERLGLKTAAALAAGRHGIWMHAASVGELRMARLLAPALARARPDLPILLSVTSRAARALVATPPPGVAAAVFLPLDLPPLVDRTVTKLAPRLFVALETELWPNLMTALERHRVPAVIVNGRISDRSLPRYRRLGSLTRRTVATLRLVCARTATDALRFEQLGLLRGRAPVTGDLKFDGPEPTRSAIAPELLAALGGQRVLIAGSTHAGEEEVVLAAARRAAERLPHPILVVLAPRHAHRQIAVEALLGSSGLDWRRRSALPQEAAAPPGSRPGRTPRVLLLDTHGELASLYAAADVAFIGGTLAPVGGHSLLEAAVAGVPMVAGPSCDGIRDTAALLQSQGGLLIGRDTAEIVEHLTRLLSDDTERQRQGQAARVAIARERGAVGRVMAQLLPLLEPTP